MRVKDCFYNSRRLSQVWLNWSEIVKFKYIFCSLIFETSEVFKRKRNPFLNLTFFSFFFFIYETPITKMFVPTFKTVWKQNQRFQNRCTYLKYIPYNLSLYKSTDGHRTWSAHLVQAHTGWLSLFSRRAERACVSSSTK